MFGGDGCHFQNRRFIFPCFFNAEPQEMYVPYKFTMDILIKTSTVEIQDREMEYEF